MNTTQHQYFDCNNTPICEGCYIRLYDGRIKEVYLIDDGCGNNDLGILATSEAFLKSHPGASLEYYSLRPFGRENVSVIASPEEVRKHGESLKEALQHGFTAGDLDRITVHRNRMSATQGEAVVCVDGLKVISFGDTIAMRRADGSYTDGFKTFCAAEVPEFLDVIGGWGSIYADSHFIIAAIAHPLDNIYHYSDRLRSALAKEPA